MSFTETLTTKILFWRLGFALYLLYYTGCIVAKTSTTSRGPSSLQPWLHGHTLCSESRTTLIEGSSHWSTVYGMCMTPVGFDIAAVWFNALGICIWLEKSTARVEVRGHTCRITRLHLMWCDMSQWSRIQFMLCNKILRSEVSFCTVVSLNL